MATSAGERASNRSRAYGRGLAQNFGIEDAPAVVTRVLTGAEIAVTELRVDKPNSRLSDAMPADDAYMICLLLRDLPRNSYWEEGREVGVFDLQKGQTSISDLRRQPCGLINRPIHTMLTYLPQATLNALADQAEAPRVDELRFEPGAGVFDETLSHIGFSLLPALRAPGQVSRLFTDHVTLAMASYAAETFGGMRLRSKTIQGGLAPWQEKRAKEMLAGDLTGSTPLQEIATACGISVSHLSRAFRRTTGLAPHAWLLQARVEAAKSMLRKRNIPLPEVARLCGFADQSHFTRVFTQRAGLSPGAWRRIVS
jgi:AraC family transcriptional regulator